MSGPVLIAGGVPLGDALAEELLLATRLLGELAYDLGSDEAVLRRHLASLQSVDRVTQMLLIVADLLRIGRGHEAAACITLEDMAARLGPAMGAAGTDALGLTPER